jgi:hypothetical protein
MFKKIFYKSEYEKVLFYDKITTYVLNFLGFLLWAVFFFTICVLIYGLVYYPEKFKELY